MRATGASTGNDHRLGGNETPPAIISIFLGDELTAIVNSMEAMRKEADILEQLTAKNYWPYPTYSDLLYY